MTQPGPSKEYRDLLDGRLSPDQYLRKVKKDVDRRLEEQRSNLRRDQRRRQAAAG
jgi:hypothetical protein